MEESSSYKCDWCGVNVLGIPIIEWNGQSDSEDGDYLCATCYVKYEEQLEYIYNQCNS